MSGVSIVGIKQVNAASVDALWNGIYFELKPAHLTEHKLMLTWVLGQTSILIYIVYFPKFFFSKHF